MNATSWKTKNRGKLIFAIIATSEQTYMNQNRYIFLDGMRGMAAIFILMGHTNIYWGFELTRNYLAVDLFFILSGFVIANAYDEKIRCGIIRLPKFIIIRLTRLYPVFLLSLLLFSALTIYGVTVHPTPPAVLIEVAGSLALTTLFLPSHLGGYNLFFPINPPCWSLFYELTSNVIYAAIRPLLNNFTLTTIVIFFALVLIGASYQYENFLNFGWQWGYQSIFGGFTRSVFGVFLGLLLHRNHAFLKHYLGNKVSPWIAFTVIAIILSSPNMGDFNWLIDAMSVTVFFPLCVFFASLGNSTRLDKILLTLGSASYPMYVLHTPVLNLLNRILKFDVGAFAPLSGAALVVLLIAISIIVEKYYDIPLRRWISNKDFYKR